MEPIELEPRYTSGELPGKCIKCLAEQELNNYLLELLKGGEDGQKLQGATIVAFRHAESLKLIKGIIS